MSESQNIEYKSSWHDDYLKWIYYRSGSVMQGLTGVALSEFLLKRAGRTWDDVVEPRTTLSDIDEKSLKAYIVMSKEKGRLSDVEVKSSEPILGTFSLIISNNDS